MNYKEYQKSRDLSWQILINENVTELPVKVVKLCHDLGISVYYYTPDDDNDGKCMIIDGVPYIFVSRLVSAERQRFTVAHELGHILLGHVGKYKLVNREPAPNDDPIEQEANIFASRLLAPACVLWGCGVNNADEIASLCNISKTAAEYRMERMKLLYERDRNMRHNTGRGCFLLSSQERAVYNQFLPYINKNRIRAPLKLENPL
ncbi:MAG: ImmA/IrrE family metallo-endopeptidase [Oscillospiraceae bacterium]|nr:ImmA/IrrE family metallo-endopeptidase [Oscillospiraceae bacterium]